MVFGNNGGEWKPLLQRSVLEDLYEPIILTSLTTTQKEGKPMKYTLGELILALNGDTKVDTTDISAAVTALLLWCKEECGDMQNLAMQYTGVSLPNATLSAYLPNTLSQLYRDAGVEDLLSATHAGYYAIARISRLWSEQNNLPEADFTNAYPTVFYSDLKWHTTQMGETIRIAPSTRGDTVQLYHLDVLKVVFPTVDMSELEVA